MINNKRDAHSVSGHMLSGVTSEVTKNKTVAGLDIQTLSELSFLSLTVTSVNISPFAIKLDSSKQIISQ